jgi:hypothetical protein
MRRLGESKIRPIIERHVLEVLYLDRAYADLCSGKLRHLECVDTRGLSRLGGNFSGLCDLVLNY